MLDDLDAAALAQASASLAAAVGGAGDAAPMDLAAAAKAVPLESRGGVLESQGWPTNTGPPHPPQPDPLSVSAPSGDASPANTAAPLTAAYEHAAAVGSAVVDWDRRPFFNGGRATRTTRTKRRRPPRWAARRRRRRWVDRTRRPLCCTRCGATPASLRSRFKPGAPLTGWSSPRGRGGRRERSRRTESRKPARIKILRRYEKYYGARVGGDDGARPAAVTRGGRLGDRRKGMRVLFMERTTYTNARNEPEPTPALLAAVVLSAHPAVASFSPTSPIPRDPSLPAPSPAPARSGLSARGSRARRESLACAAPAKEDVPKTPLEFRRCVPCPIAREPPPRPPTLRYAYLKVVFCPPPGPTRTVARLRARRASPPATAGRVSPSPPRWPGTRAPPRRGSPSGAGSRRPAGPRRSAAPAAEPATAVAQRSRA